MKNSIFFVLILFVFSLLAGENVERFLSKNAPSYSIGTYRTTSIFHVYEISDSKNIGFLVTDIEGENIIAYSLDNNIDQMGIDFLTAVFKQYQNFKPSIEKKDFQQWPEQGTTPTGGWLPENWGQSSPYNAKCPKDLAHGGRSVVGCPATAMSMILYYLKNFTSYDFGESDRYHHNYGGNNFWVDDDHENYDFPDFETINNKMAEIQSKFDSQTALSNEDKAYMSAVCGFAAKQVYSSSVSGTFGIDQALQSYKRMGYLNSILIQDDYPFIEELLMSEMKRGRPAHLGIVDENVTVGHNVVVDGYNTDGFYHINFGWNGSNNCWVQFPLSGMPYSLNFIEGIVCKIEKEPSGLYTEVNITNPQNGGYINLTGNLLIEVNGMELINSAVIYNNGYEIDCDLVTNGIEVPIENINQGSNNFEIMMNSINDDQVFFSLYVNTTNQNEFLFENFDTSSWLDNGWSIVSENPMESWYQSNYEGLSYTMINFTNIYSMRCKYSLEMKNEWLVSPILTLGSSCSIDFWTAYNSNWVNNANLSLKIETDNGGNWEELWISPNDNQNWKWRHNSIDLSEYEGQKVRLAFVYYGVDGDDILVDDIFIGGDVVTDLSDINISSFKIINSYPNPFNPTSRVNFYSEKSSEFRFFVYNELGQLIYKEKSLFERGYSSFVFHGDSFESGIYFYVVQNKDGLRATGKMVMVK
ncbi:MAG: C10 family peptidase [Candidatus Delongbacteria bacterium]|nr:C10 family peptidase [Candidatus Delongbacteria bacterium]MBN2836788.1 C10 family peptidase [Candidatus Delongbacteria bacterium]